LGTSSTISITWNNFTNPSVFGGYATEQIAGHVYCLSGDKITVDHNTCSNSGGQGVIFCYNAGIGTTNSIISNNHCEGNGQEGCTVYGGSSKLTSNNSVINNTSINNRFHQIEIWQSDNNTVTGNTVQENIIGRGNIGAITLYNSTGTTCTGNKVLCAQNNGIAIVAGSSNCIVSNNTIANTNGRNDVGGNNQYGNGILLDWDAVGDPQYLTIENNTISSSVAMLNKSGIYSTSNTIHHNKIDGNVFPGYEYRVHPYALATCGA